MIDKARAICAAHDGGTVEMAPGTVARVDWTGPACPTMASGWGGTGGSALSILIEGPRFEHMAFGWTVVKFDGPVLLLSQHGVNCNATGGDRCVQAPIWTAGTLTGAGWPTGEDEGGARPEGE